MKKLFRWWATALISVLILVGIVWTILDIAGCKGVIVGSPLVRNAHCIALPER